MDAPAQSFFPLANASQQNLAKVCQALRGWSPCAQWISGNPCQQSLQPSGCSCQRAAKLEPFFDYYRDTTAYYVPDLTGDTNPALRSHDDLVDIIVLLNNNADKPRSTLTTEYFGHRAQHGSYSPPATYQSRAFSLAARIISMVQCSVENQSDGLLEAGTQPTTWHSDKSFTDFINSVFHKREQPALNPDENIAASSKVHLTSVAAKRLTKVARLKIIPTDDLRNHLLLNGTDGTLAIYHYTSVLKEHIHASRDEDKENIPRQLAVETLDTLQKVLFPIDPESQSLLRSLVSKSNFDPDILRLESSFYRRPEEQQDRYQYWGSRLIDLYDELGNPKPRGFFEKWLERKSGARYVMMATLAGVIIAVILGFFGLAVSIFQAWVGWQQWKHPVSGN